MIEYEQMKMEMFVLNTNDNYWMTIIEEKNYSKIMIILNLNEKKDIDHIPLAEEQ